MEKYFISKGNKYIIKDNKILELFNGGTIEPGKDELIRVKEMIKNYGKDIFSSDRLNSIAKENPELYKIDVLPEVLSMMEGFIKDEYLENFYENLRTVKFHIEDSTTDEDEKDYSVTGFHDTKTNTIVFNLDTFEFVRNSDAEKDKDFTSSYKIMIAHELFHLASYRNSSDGICYQGLNKYDQFSLKNHTIDIDEFRKVESFNEGTTELFANFMYHRLDVNSYSDGYIESVRIVAQIVNMIGIQTLKKAYFDNLGIDYIKRNLCDIINSPDLFYELFDQMGIIIDFENIDEDIRCSSVIKIQNILLRYEKEYINKLRKSKSDDEIDGFIAVINKYFVGLWRDIDFLDEKDKALANENRQLFYNLKEKEKTYKK